jgi:hypothetical protein
VVGIPRPRAWGWDCDASSPSLPRPLRDFPKIPNTPLGAGPFPTRRESLGTLILPSKFGWRPEFEIGPHVCRRSIPPSPHHRGRSFPMSRAPVPGRPSLHRMTSVLPIVIQARCASRFPFYTPRRSRRCPISRNGYMDGSETKRDTIRQSRVRTTKSSSFAHFSQRNGPSDNERKGGAVIQENGRFADGYSGPLSLGVQGCGNVETDSVSRRRTKMSTSGFAST